MNTIVPLAADERLSAAFARYDEEWSMRGEGLPAARLELCKALLACDETLPPSVVAQMARDREAVDERVVITV